MSASLFRSTSASLVRSHSGITRHGFGDYGFGGPTISVADLGSLTRLEVRKYVLFSIIREKIEITLYLINRPHSTPVNSQY